MPTVRIELRNRPDKQGRCQLRFVLQEKKKRIFVATTIKLLPKYWDSINQAVKSTHSQASIINSVLSLKLADLEGKMAIDNLIGDGSLEKVAGRAISKTSFKEFTIEQLGDWEQTKSENTIRAYQSMLRKVNEFDSNVAVEDITPDWLYRYEQWSRKGQDGKDGTAAGGTLKRLSFVSTIIKESIRKGIIKVDPFLIYRMPPKINPQKVWLTMDEINRIESYLKETGSDTLKVTGYWFLLACYTGLRYSDIETFNHKKHVQDGRLVLYTQKTGEIVSIKTTGKIKELLTITESLGPVFSNQKSNQYLKAIANFSEIDKNISFHTARHTFAVNCANLGISQEVTSKLLGHSDLRTTQVYYKIINQRIDNEMDKWG